jgi:hypothetical protein
MGKTFSTGLLTNGLWQDSSNNIGIGGAANASFKLQVTGATNLTGALTGTSAEFSGNNHSLASNNTLRFTDTDTATEANQQIGKIEFYSSDTSTPGAGVKAYIGAFAQDTTPDAYLSFATQDGSATPNPVERLRISSEGAAIFSSSVTASGISSTGTNTMLSASSSTAGLVVRGGSSIGTASLASGQIFVGQTATYRLSLAYDDNTGYAYIDNLYDNANSNIYFRVRTNGTPINALTLFGSGAATFSSSVTATGANLSGNIVLNRPSTSAGNNIEWRTANTLNWYIGTRGLVDNNFYFVNEGLGSNNLILNASTGAATFSSSVTASSLTSTGDLFLTNTGAVVFNSAANFNTQIYHSSGSLVFYTGASERARITSGGNVLIGTTTDTGYMLRVTGYANIGGNLVVNGDATITNSLTLSNPTTYTGKYTSDAVTVTGGAAGGGGGTIIIGDSNYVGLLIVSISTQNCVGIFLISSSSQVLLVSQTTTETRFSTTAGALNTANIYFSGSNLILENNIQATRNFRMNFIGKIA